MADTATPALTATQANESYDMWNSDDWYDNFRWTLTGTMEDSDFKSGLWWRDAEDMAACAPILREFAAQWRREIEAMRQQKGDVDKASQTYAGNKGVNAQKTTSALADISRALQQKMDDLAPVPAALEQQADVLERNLPIVNHYWGKWENDRANFESCHADVVAMTPAIQAQAKALLQAANAIQTPWKNMLHAPTVTVPKNTNGGSSIDDETQAALTGGTPISNAKVDAVKTAGNMADDRSKVSTAGTVVKPVSETGLTSGVSFAGPISGNGATVNPVGFGSTPGSMPAAASLPGTGAGVAPMGGFGAIGGFGAGIGGGAGSSSGVRGVPTGEPVGGSPLFPVGKGSESEDEGVARKSTGSRAGAGAARGAIGAPPMIGGMPQGGAAGGRRGAEIRPGYAKPVQRGGVAEGLLGRAAKDSEFSEVVGSRKRRPNKRQERNGTVQFLDEEAWLTDDPGSGVVTADDTPAQTDVPAPRIGRPSVG